MSHSSNARLIAFYLPQYHPIPENDEWWGKGFTEWTNVARAKPLFHGHYQPHVPADLGFYDLRVPETRIAQAEMAREYGIEAFCYYHYWFGGRQLLERPLNEVVASGEPDFPFCVCWANQSWTGTWHGCADRMLIEQTYPGDADHVAHFNALLPSFSDPRYVTVDGKILFLIYRPLELPFPERVTTLWREMAEREGLKGIHFVGVTSDPAWVPEKYGFDGAVLIRFTSRGRWISRITPVQGIIDAYQQNFSMPFKVNYEDAISDLAPIHDFAGNKKHYPSVIPNWDNTPRCGKNGYILHASSPELFQGLLRQALTLTKSFPNDEKLVFLKSWNEWAEGNHLEPDLRYGKAYLEIIRDEMMKQNL
jgi:lipopolysaccharide biosynthesis protein